ncbi:hypothetical protein [Chryseobacterium oncorhynchi]|uniref:Uncharacterized protein n=1 Tax=Chryseobacterium oncorhynchi TaxID=741074 RepID=A0A316WLH9_9FLAO|nr:hypothetical protein [Chryseobacterium oncorhynchi]PWN62292.1 hypothetical protein C1638_017520 [Chryseobacterium oncorhynchi]
MEINGFEYSQQEVLDALKAKGYLILNYETYEETPIHGSCFARTNISTKCAVKGNELPSDDNIWHLVAKRIFSKPESKPSLI